MRRGSKKSLLGWVLLVSLVPICLPVRGLEGGPITVLQVRPETVSIDLGRQTDLKVGSRLEVQREGEPVAELEVLHLVEGTASCRIVRQDQVILVGDTVLRLADLEEAPEVPLRVRQVVGDTVYLDGGRSHGLGPGRRARVERDGQVVGEIEITHVASRSAASRLLRETQPLSAGDLVIPAPVEEASREAVVVSAGESQPASPGEEGAAATDPNGSKAEAQPPEPAARAAAAGERRESRRPAAKVPWARLSGTVQARLHSFADGSGDGRDFDQTTLRLNLRLRQIGGSPYELRVRLRGRESRRAQPDGPDDLDRSDRVYEVSLAYEPPDGRISYRLGRLASGPLVGFDYLDGLLGEVKMTPRLRLGGFVGSRSEIEGLGLESTGQSYGLFLHYRRDRSRESPFFADVLVGGIGEYQDGTVSRERVSIYGRLGSGNRWSLYQRAEVDLNRDWREEQTGESFQVSNVLFSGTYRVSETLRFGLSYDLRRRILEAEDRLTPEEIFDDQLRDGVRLTVYLGRSRGWRTNNSIGLRRQQGVSEDSWTLNGSIFNSNVGAKDLLLGFDYSGFSGASSEAYRLGLRANKYFNGGHDLGITLGQSVSTSMATEEERTNQWIRLTGTARLPRRFFLLGELELATGDDLEGERLILQLGYRL